MISASDKALYPAFSELKLPLLDRDTIIVGVLYTHHNHNVQQFFQRVIEKNLSTNMIELRPKIF